MTHNAVADAFVKTYTRALLARDAPAVAAHYAVPALILFPGRSIAVSDPAQTQGFFAGAFEQYAGVTRADSLVDVVAASAHSLWLDVTWTYDHAPGERNLYQLVETPDGWRIAVLTPLDAVGPGGPTAP